VTTSIIQKKLTSLEVAQLIEETRKFPDLIYVSSNHWLKFNNPYCLLVDGQFAGVCVTYDHKDFVKIGPLILLSKFHGKGLGEKILRHVVRKNINKSLLITSSNPAVGKIVQKLGFEKVANIFLLSKNMRWFLANQLTEYLNLHAVKEWIRKRILFQRGKRAFYLKFTTPQS
jgi:ribosomal protein S18 acetylase RimI-like enzyme